MRQHPGSEKLHSSYVESDGAFLTALEVTTEVQRQLRDLTWVRSLAKVVTTNEAGWAMGLG